MLMGTMHYSDSPTSFPGNDTVNSSSSNLLVSSIATHHSYLSLNSRLNGLIDLLSHPGRYTTNIKHNTSLCVCVCINLYMVVHVVCACMYAW